MDQMKPVKIVLLAFAVVLSAGLVLADPIPDPFIKLGGGGGSGRIVLLDFVVTSMTGTSPAGSPCILHQNDPWLPPGLQTQVVPDCVFQNLTTETIMGLTFDIGGDQGTIVCENLETSPFSGCSVIPMSGFTRVLFSGGSIPDLAEFSLIVEGFRPDTSFNATAATVPEPGTITLFLVGLGTLLARRRSLTR